MLKALIVVRLSRVTDATTSPERQLETCRELCAQRSYEVIGVASDLDVSGAVDPFDRKKRPNLARWLHREHVRSMNVRLTFDHAGIHLELGDIFQLTEQMNATGPVVDYQKILAGIRDTELVAGVRVGVDGDIRVVSTRGDVANEDTDGNVVVVLASG